MQRALPLILAAIFLLTPTAMVAKWVRSANQRLVAEQAAAANDTAAQNIAQAADVGYCNADLKRVLRRVVQSCGLAGPGGTAARGCAPADARNVAQMAPNDFNALFLPLADRAGIVEFDRDSAELDPRDLELVNKLFADQRGASYFFVVSRASPEGNTEHNTELSRQRAEAVMSHLRRTFNDPDLDKEVGLLVLGEEYAQLDQQFCAWQRSGDPQACTEQNINRSAFIAWIDCRL